MKGIATRGNSICFGKFALQAGRRAITRYARRGGKLWIRIFPDKPITMRPAETRMGSGKGSPEYWVSVVKPGRILYEISGIPETIARAAVRIAAYKMPIRTQFITITSVQKINKENSI
jgi:large subunit ribosomal protein L16